VTGNCDADLVLLLSSGFEPVKAPSPVGVLPAPENLRLSLTGISGELYLRFDRVPNAANYSVQTAQNPDGPWEDQDLSPSTRVTISGLTPGKVYWVRSQANRSARRQRLGGPANAMVCKKRPENRQGPVTPEQIEVSPQRDLTSRGEAKVSPRFCFSLELPRALGTSSYKDTNGRTFERIAQARAGRPIARFLNFS
jgi:hypothetical protein